MSFRDHGIGLLAIAGIALLSATAAVGWLMHGEAIFLRMAEAAWATCF